MWHAEALDHVLHRRSDIETLPDCPLLLVGWKMIVQFRVKSKVSAGRRMLHLNAGFVAERAKAADRAVRRQACGISAVYRRKRIYRPEYATWHARAGRHP